MRLRYRVWAGPLLALVSTHLAVANSLCVTPVTVCEVLADLPTYMDKPVAILGKFYGGSLIDGCCALVEDRCKQGVITEVKHYENGITTGYAWENRINLVKREAVPRNLLFDSPEFQEKLRIAGLWTHLGCYDSSVMKPDRTFFTRKVRERWAVAYGRLEVRKVLRGPKGTPGTLTFQWGNGFGHLGAAPAQLIYSKIQFIGSSDCPGQE